MTKRQIRTLIKRYPYISKGINADKEKIEYYVGKRKQSIDIDVKTKAVYEIVNGIYNEERDEYKKQMLKGIMTGKSDISISVRLPYSKTTYNRIKNEIITKVFEICILNGLVERNEI